jgi:cobyrinic acid a,c-diamide synthase
MYKLCISLGEIKGKMYKLCISLGEIKGKMYKLCISLGEIKGKMRTSDLNVSTYIITSLTAHPIILVVTIEIMSVSTAMTVHILYMS